MIKKPFHEMNFEEAIYSLLKAGINITDYDSLKEEFNAEELRVLAIHILEAIYSPYNL